MATAARAARLVISVCPDMRDPFRCRATMFARPISYRWTRATACQRLPKTCPILQVGLFFPLMEDAMWHQNPHPGPGRTHASLMPRGQTTPNQEQVGRESTSSQKMSPVGSTITSAPFAPLPETRATKAPEWGRQRAAPVEAVRTEETQAIWVGPSSTKRRNPEFCEAMRELWVAPEPSWLVPRFGP